MGDTMDELIKYGGDLGNTFLLTGAISTVIWLQGMYPGIAPVLLITGGFVIVYTNWLKRRNAKKDE